MLIVRSGIKSAAELFDAEQHDNVVLTWILRAVGALLMFIGLALILRPLVVVADVVPFIGSILGAGAALVALAITAVVAPLIVAVAWFFYRPVVSVAILAVGLAAAYGFRKWAAQRTAARAAQPVPPAVATAR